MNNNLSPQEIEDMRDKLMAPVISLWEVNTKDTRQKKIVAKGKMKITLFYTSPIFKSRKHDFL